MGLFAVILGLELVCSACVFFFCPNPNASKTLKQVSPVIDFWIFKSEGSKFDNFELLRYCGFLYNDFFSIGLTLFESRWTQPAISPETKAGSVVAMQPKFDHQNQGALLGDHQNPLLEGPKEAEKIGVRCMPNCLSNKVMFGCKSLLV